MKWTIYVLGVGVVLLFVLLLRKPLGDTLINRIARGIAQAEGFYIQGSRPQRNHNPGDLKVDTTGKGTGKDDGGFVVYANDQDGWDALKQQVRLFFHGSQYYNPGMTILEIAKKYTVTDIYAWATTVANSLGVSIGTKLEDV